MSAILIKWQARFNSQTGYTMLTDYTTAQLREELQRREYRIRPTQVPNIDWDYLIEYVEEQLDYIEEHNHKPKDFKHCLYEKTLETIYGFAIFEFLNSLDD